MFAATVVFCALVDREPDFDRCQYFRDTLGPYTTVEECVYRSNMIQIDILKSTVIMQHIYLNLDNPNELTFRSICLRDGQFV